MAITRTYQIDVQKPYRAQYTIYETKHSEQNNNCTCASVHNMARVNHKQT